MKNEANRVHGELRRELAGTVSVDVPLAPHTSFNIGGTADLWIEPRDLRDLSLAMAAIARFEFPLTVMGLGSNVLISDRGVRGAVVCLKRSFREVAVYGETVTAGAGVTMPLLSQQVAKLGLTGYEWACGIPGLIGGAAAMNAGAHGGETADSLVEVQVVRVDGEAAWLSSSDLEFSYRSSSLKRGGSVVTACRFQFFQEDPAVIHESLKELRDRRRRSQPETSQCAGSIFKNPSECSAGQLLERLGAKGMREGGAEVSPKHANFIINSGGAKASDVRTLISRLQELARLEAGVELETEVLMIGDWE